MTAFRPGQSPPPVSMPIRMRPPEHQFRALSSAARPRNGRMPRSADPPRTMDNEEPEAEAAAKQLPDSPAAGPPPTVSRTEARLRKLAGRNRSAYTGPLIALARAGSRATAGCTSSPPASSISRCSPPTTSCCAPPASSPAARAGAYSSTRSEGSKSSVSDRSPSAPCASSATSTARSGSSCARTRPASRSRASCSRARDPLCPRPRRSRGRYMTCVIAIDAGTTGVRAFAVGTDGAAWATSYREFPQHFPGRAGSSTTRGHLAGRSGRRRRRCPPRRPGDRRRDRDHQPARDDGRVGSAHRAAAAPGDRLAGPAHGGRVRRAARGRAATPHPRHGPAWCSTPTSRAPSWNGCWTPTARGDTAEPGLAFGTVDSWVLWNLTGGPDGGVPPPTSRTPRARCSTTSGALDWSDELCALFGVPAILPGGPALVRTVRRDRARRARGSAAPFRSAGIAATSRPPCSARRASPRA